MLLVKTYLSASPLHGIGLFAAEPIAAGTIIWRFHQGFDLVLKLSDVDLLPKPARDQIMHYGFIDPPTGELILCIDDSRFFNHSVTPTTTSPLVTPPDEPYGLTIAGRDIKKGEELTYDYLREDLDGARKLGL